ncbi:Alpha/Beta hydrolase protein [Geopyxis carbonaria]|nr:Alpha/Beta hydrolase protein [Geopyxis carbonaria]
MSDLQKEFLRAKLQHLPREPPMPYSTPENLISLAEAEEEESIESIPLSPLTDDSSSASSASSTGTIRPSTFIRPLQPRKKPNFEPIPWNEHFSSSLLLTSPNNDKFHAYFTPPSPVGPLFVSHHGAGSSGLSFALLASEIRKILPSAGMLSFDCRGHGETHTSDNDDLSLATLSKDLETVIYLVMAHCGWTSCPDIVLVGHSLGGAVVVNVASSGNLGNCVLGYAVLDVVEGSAIDALQSMQVYLSTRPSGFVSLSQGIEWHTRTRTIRNPTSARISVPALLSNNGDGTGPRPWHWRTDLGKTQPFWEGWFVGLSKRFLEGRGGKLLILAGTDRLDKELMIGQMQGKYQLMVLPEVGHFVHEDAPEKTAVALVDFYTRNNRSMLVLPPKVSNIIPKAK